MRFHFVGIGGAGMSVVAELLHSQGATISGSDAKASAVTAHLEGLGIAVSIGQAAQNVPRDAVVVVSSAIRDENPELAAARAHGQRVLHRSQALALAAEGRDFVAVAGAHGKTTTSAMIATALSKAGFDPSWAIGGSVTGYGAGGHLGSGQVVVAEADESDGSFLNYQPRIEVVTNVEPDHLDHYGTRAAFEQAFVEFSELLVPGGLLVVCSDDDGAKRLGMQAIENGLRVVSYGRGSGIGGEEKHVRITQETHDAGVASGLFDDGVARYPVTLRVVGAHNLLNAAGAWVAGVELGVEGMAMAAALTEFAGTGRRFEIRGTAHGVTVVDDYGHHPTEVAATLRAARERVGDGRVLAIFQPHLYSRTRNFAAEFAKALELADYVIVTGVYAAREDPMDGVDGYLISDKMAGGAAFVEDKFEAARSIAHVAKPGDMVLTIGAGDVTELGPFILEEIAAL